MKTVKAFSYINHPADPNVVIEEDAYLLTEKEVEMLNKGEMTFHNGHFYLTKDVPLKVDMIDFGIKLFPVSDNGDKKPKLSDLTIGDKTWDQSWDNPLYNKPTRSQVQRSKGLIENVEIIGVTFKDSRFKLSKDHTQCIRDLIDYITTKHAQPYEWIQFARVRLEGCVDKEGFLRTAVLEILNNAIPLKPNMKLENFSAGEFNEKYLYAQQSLLEKFTPKHDPGLNSIRELEFILKEIYHFCNHDKLETFQQFSERAGILYGEYKGQVNMLDHYDLNFDLAKWDIAIDLQSTYWEVFRGRTITILKLFNKFLNPGIKRYHLENPILGSKKN